MSKTTYDYAERIIDPACLAEGQIKTNGSMLRGSLYKAMYIKSYRDHMPDITLQKLELRSEINGQDPVDVQRYVMLRSFAACVIGHEPMQTRNFVISRASSPEEAAAITALAPTLNTCLQSGAEIKFSKTMLAGLLAEVLYRISSNVLTTAVK